MSPTDATSDVPAAPEGAEGSGADTGTSTETDTSTGTGTGTGTSTETDTDTGTDDLGAATVRTPPVTETDPLLVQVGDAIDEAKEAAHEVYGGESSGSYGADESDSDEDVDPNLGQSAPVP